jgi:hypothetical protein
MDVSSHLGLGGRLARRALLGYDPRSFVKSATPSFPPARSRQARPRQAAGPVDGFVPLLG